MMSSSLGCTHTSAEWPGVRSLGQKEFIEDDQLYGHSGGRSPSRGHGGALMRKTQDSRDGPCAQGKASQLIALSRFRSRVPITA